MQCSVSDRVQDNAMRISMCSWPVCCEWWTFYNAYCDRNRNNFLRKWCDKLCWPTTWHFFLNVLGSVSGKEFWKSTNIWWSYVITRWSTLNFDSRSCGYTDYWESAMLWCRLLGMKTKRKKMSSNVGGADGQIGRYVRGVQVIDSKDLRRVRSKIASNSRDWLIAAIKLWMVFCYIFV